jgi:hypothetical protein
MLIICESLSYPRSSSYFCVSKLIAMFKWLRLCSYTYWAILIHSTLLHPISLIQILIRHYPSINMVSFTDVLIDNLHKNSIIGFVISRVCFVASVLFNILMTERLWEIISLIGISYAETSKWLCWKFRTVRSHWNLEDNKNVATLPLIVFP